MSASKDPELEATYSQLLRLPSTHEKAIIRDLNRTFPSHEYFHDKAGVGQNNLLNIMKAYSLYDDEVGYCQGMAFVVGPLLLNVSFLFPILRCPLSSYWVVLKHDAATDARRRSILRPRQAYEVIRSKITIYPRHARSTIAPVSIRPVIGRTPSSSLPPSPTPRHQIINVCIAMVPHFIGVPIPAWIGLLGIRPDLCGRSRGDI